MISKRAILAIALVVLAENVFAFAPESGAGEMRSSQDNNLSSNVIIIGWDGVQRDHLRQCLAGSSPGCFGLPNIQNLSGGKIFNITVTSAATATKPGWAEILTGYNAEHLGILDNKHFKPLPKGYSILERLEEHFGDDKVVTIFLAGKDENLGGDCSSDPLGLWCEANRSLDRFQSALGGNEEVGRMALQLLEIHKDERIFAFFHFAEPDLSGHLFGENSSRYSAALQDDDLWLGKIVGKLKELGIYNQTLIYVITDHGFDEGRRTHQNAPYGFLASNDPAILRSGDRKDLASTLLKRFGLPLCQQGPIPAVDGTPLDIIPAGCIAEGEAYIDYPGAPGCCDGLDLTNLTRERASSKGLSCTPATGGANDRSGYCVRCADGIIKQPENRCNCPA